MPRGRSTFAKRQKEQARQQKARDKAERRSRRKQEKPEVNLDDEMRKLREHGEAQAALFRMGPGQPSFVESSADDTKEAAPQAADEDAKQDEVR
jgi:hypothetical protein